MRRSLLSLPFILLSALAAVAAPLSIKELDLMVRMKVPEAQIRADLASRQLEAPLNIATEQKLRGSGASEALLASIRQALVAPVGRTATKGSGPSSPTAPAGLDLPVSSAGRDEAAAKMAHSPVMSGMFGPTLLMADGTSANPARLNGVSVYALYYSAHWCGPCRQFTPSLVEWYKRFKPSHPYFELIFVSADHSADDMRKYMKEAAMPWPAVAFEKRSSAMQRWSGNGIPWLVIVAADGTPISVNGQTKEWIDPRKILTDFEQALASAK